MSMQQWSISCPSCADLPQLIPRLSNTLVLAVLRSETEAREVKDKSSKTVLKVFCFYVLIRNMNL